MAVALELAGADTERPQARRANPDRGPDLDRFLSGLDSSELVELLLERVESDWRLRERLAARALATGGGSMDVRTWKRRIDAVFGDRRSFIPYAEAGGWAQDIFDVIDLTRLGEAARAASATRWRRARRR